MAASSKFRGHDIEFKSGEWVYSESGKRVITSWNDTPCGHCGKDNTKEGHDGCLGTLPGLMSACCGHGSDSEAYVQYLDGSIISGEPAMVIIEAMKIERGEVVPVWREVKQ